MQLKARYLGWDISVSRGETMTLTLSFTKKKKRLKVAVTNDQGSYITILKYDTLRDFLVDWAIPDYEEIADYYVNISARKNTGVLSEKEIQNLLNALSEGEVDEENLEKMKKRS